MTKNSEPQDKRAGGAARRRPERKNFTKFQWDSVDDQAQEDLIEPVATLKSKRTRVAKKRDKDVGTMYVVSSDDLYPNGKRKVVEAPHAEDYASFVAEIDEGEEDPYATPSYGRTRLTHNDEALVEELAAPVERKEKRTSERPRRARKDVARAAEEREVNEEETPEEIQKSVSKRSFLSKIKEAISTGGISTGAASYDATRARASKGATSSGVSLTSTKRLNSLTRSAKKILDATGVSLESGSFDDAEGRPQVEVLVDLVEALIKSNLALVEKIGATSEKKASVERVQRSKRASRNVDVDAEEPNFVENSEKKEQDVPRRASRVQEQTRKEPKSSEGRRESKAPSYFDVDDDDFDPIAAWENMPDDEEDAQDEPAPRVKSKVRERGTKPLYEENDDFDDWNEADSKKKSARIRQDSQDKSLFETSSSLNATDVVSHKEPVAKHASKRGGSRADKERVRPSREESAPLEKFGDLKLEKATLKALQQMGYVEPTPIQAGTIPRIQAGVDLMGQARTGTGKTAAFMIPIVEAVDACEPCDAPLALAVAPTRELAVQIRDETQRLARYRDLNVVACYGGKPIASQVEKIRKGVDILVGTPGRIIDLTNRGVLNLSKARWVVLDEADRMLDIGFRPDVERILRQTPRSRQTLLFSATLAPPVVRLAKAYMKEPEEFDFSQKDVSAETIEQYYLTVDQDRKFDALVRLLEIQNPRQAIVFCRTKRHVDMLGRRLAAQFKAVEAIHGDLPQGKRDRIMSDFRAEKTKILVATDIVGRGIDVSTVSHIVNYDVPQFCDDYVHRVGRAGRMGREGVAFTLVTAEEGAELTRIEIRINRLLERFDLPGFEAFSKPVEGTNDEPDRFERKPVFGQTRRRVRRAL